MAASQLYKVYVTERGLVPAEKIEGKISELCPVRDKVSIEDQRYLAWLGPYRGAKEYSREALFKQSVFVDYKDCESFLPIIHVCVTKDFLKEDKDNQVARYSQISDSSIWNYFLKAEIQNGKLVAPMLQYAIDAIRNNYNRDKYNLMVAREYANLHYRLVKESRLQGDDHALRVSPFLFHSEQKMHESVERLKESIVSHKYHWKVLLLDDCAVNKRMKTFPENNTLERNHWGLYNNNKLSIILDQLTECGFHCQWGTYSKEQTSSPKLEKGKDLLVFCTHSIKETKEVLSKERFDIILLDYKLIDEYSYQLLKEISDNDILKKQAGIADKYCFMYISAYTTAIQERLFEQGLTRNEPYWYIGQGACPTNTPEMFKFYLLALMKWRLVQTGIQDLSYEKIFEEVAHIFIVPNSDSIEREKYIGSVRELAFKAYRTILGFHYDYFQLKQDQGYSLLVDSFLRDKVHFGAMLEHLLQLVHLTAFGTVRQWPEIWEEYKFFVRSINDSTGTYQASIIKISEAIERYVILLKSE